MSGRDGENRRQEMRSGPDLDALRRMRESEERRLADMLTNAGCGSAEVSEALNDLHDTLIRSTLQWAEQDMARRGLGTPPVPYAYLLFGSGGRREQTFASDQDSGIVYGNPSSEEETAACRQYFAALGETVVQSLIRLGYPPCDGNVVASNPDWCLPLAGWEERMQLWFEEPTWEHVRYLLIAADGRAVAGDVRLALRLQNKLFVEAAQSRVILRRMMENMLRYKTLIGVFGQLLPERYGKDAGTLDIKYGPYLLAVNIFRWLAIQGGRRETNTLERIQALRKAGVLAGESADRAVSAFELLLKMRLLARNKLPIRLVDKEMAAELRSAVKFYRRLQRRLQREIEQR